MTTVTSAKITQWTGMRTLNMGGVDVLNDMWRLMDAVAEEITVPPSEVNVRVDRMLKHLDPPSIFLVAEQDGHIQGICIAEVGDTENTKHVGWLRMEVHPDYRGQGIGTKLLHSMFIMARRQGIKRLEITSYEHNIRARKLFQSLGFRTEGKHYMARRDPATGALIDTYTLAKLLNGEH